MNVFADFHHDALYESLIILFEERLGYKLYRPIGKEWYDNGYWALGHGETVGQYLDVHIQKDYNRMYTDRDPLYSRLNSNVESEDDGLYTINYGYYDTPKPHKCVTLDKFTRMDFDIIISSVPQHIAPFNTLINKYQQGAKHIFQAGNNGWNPVNVNNILSSAKPLNIDNYKNSIFYHQEFDTNLFKYYPCNNPKRISNLMHCMDNENVSLFLDLEKKLDWDNKMYGGQNRDGIIIWPISNLLNCIKDSGFIWHCKRAGDGYGYNLHHALACGKPVVVRKSFFKGMTIEPLLQHGVTCIDLDVCNTNEAATLLNTMAGNYENVSKGVYEIFKNHVNFDKEFANIQQFLNNLV